jgi:prolyl oligopeptidase
MQYDQAGNAPILIRIDSNAGHGAGTSTQKLIDQYADIYSFTLNNMGYRDASAPRCAAMRGYEPRHDNIHPMDNI